jgi:hypothetical protein
MDEKLWAGAWLKLEYSEYHFNKMGQSFQPPERTQSRVALEASGAITDTQWERSFYAHFDALLSAARSVPEIIQCCFGADLANGEMRRWFSTLPGDEQARRHDFTARFKAPYDGFRALRLSAVRHISEHRTGYAPVTVTISGLFGVTYIGSPTERVPLSETRQIDDPELALLLAKPNPIQPRWDDFDIEGQPHFPACREYLNCAHTLVGEARGIALLVHGSSPLNYPPT